MKFVTIAIEFSLSTWTWRVIKSSQAKYHKWSLTICDGCFDTLKSSKMQS